MLLVLLLVLLLLLLLLLVFLLILIYCFDLNCIFITISNNRLLILPTALLTDCLINNFLYFDLFLTWLLDQPLK